ncbi:MAG: endonuclease [Hyphomicrobiaceae bacterium]|nr:endonuclease [Hyphomicrobiaceae bacterium]
MVKFVTLSFAFSVLWLASAAAQSMSINIVTWNAREVFSSAIVQDRKEDFRRFSKAMKPDILVLQEFTSCSLARQIRDAMGLQDFHLACSDFMQEDKPKHSNFEIAIISRFEFDDVVEFDATPDNDSPDEPEEERIRPLEDIGIVPTRASRGFLWVRIDDLNLSLIGVHLKSANGLVGRKDRKNARKRELVAAAIAAYINKLRVSDPDLTHVVAGDFNVGHSDAKKNGSDLLVDCYRRCRGRDRYDDTHAIFRDGLVGGLRMKNLAASITTSTFPSFPGTPIDNIYVHGPNAERFLSAVKSAQTFGSDHVAVGAKIQLLEPAGPAGGLAATTFAPGDIAAAVPKRLQISADDRYAGLAGLDGEDLRDALYELVTGHIQFTYSQVWDALMYTDEDPNNANNVILLYTQRSQDKSRRDRGGSDGDLWNREHVWPKSHGFKRRRQAAYTDIHHLRPADKSVNSTRGNLDFGPASTPLGEAPGVRFSESAFEPSDAVKGDVARMIFYMAIRYEGDDSVPDLEVVNRRTSVGEPFIGNLCALLMWHKADPPSAFEKRRNDRIEERQGNRNPFIDKPEFGTIVFGDSCK